jgi:hypothetical protein
VNVSCFIYGKVTPSDIRGPLTNVVYIRYLTSE